MFDFDVRNLKIASYARKSSDSEDKQVQSIQSQLRELGIMAERFGYRVETKYSYAETKSAFGPGRERFTQAVADIGRGYVNALAVVHANRLARNPIDAGILINLMDNNKLAAIITPTKVYLNTPTDKMMLAFEFIFSKKDSDDKSVFVKNGLKTRAINGLPTGGASIGFLNDTSTEKGNRKWKVDRERFDLISLILKRYLDGDVSAANLYKWASRDLKLTSRRHARIGGRIVQHSRFYAILKDPVYAGFFYKDGMRYELDPTLPRAITEEEHYRILKALGSNCAPKTQAHKSLFSGFIRGADGGFVGQDFKLQVICDCGRKFSYVSRDCCPSCGVSRSEMISPKYLAYIYYYNVRRKRQGLRVRCIEEKKVKSSLVEYAVGNLCIAATFANWCRERLAEIAGKEADREAVISKRKETLIQEAEAKKARYREMLASGIISTAEYREDIDRINRSLSTSARKEESWLDRTNHILNALEGAAIVLHKGQPERMREILASIGSNLIWDEKNLRIVHQKDVQVLVDGLNRARRKNPEFEPKTTLADKDETGVFASVRPLLLRGLDNVRKSLVQSTMDQEGAIHRD